MSIDQILKEKIENNRKKIETMSYEEVEKQKKEDKDKPLYECDEFKITYKDPFAGFDEHDLYIKDAEGEEVLKSLQRGILKSLANDKTQDLYHQLQNLEADLVQTGLFELTITNLLTVNKISIEDFQKGLVQAYLENEKRVSLTSKYCELKYF